MRIAYDAHHGQIDKAGTPYVFHPFHLAEQMTDEISTCVALLHDIVEDTGKTFDELAQGGIALEVIEILRLLTHDESVPYLDYVRQIKDSGNQAAIAVKLADLRHNSDLTRFDIVDGKARRRAEKYAAAIVLLEQ
jgi:(p)ppGpp synthase/HD superfamily hydrolase